MVAKTNAVYGDVSPCKIKQEVDKLLMHLGFRVTLVGTLFLQQAIELCVSCENATKINLAAEVYRPIAVRAKVSCASVERNIRHAVADCVNNGKLDRLCEHFPFLLPFGSQIPSNREFILIVAKCFRLKLGGGDVNPNRTLKRGKSGIFY